MISWKKFWTSYGYARQGLGHAFRTEHSFRVHLTAVAIVLILMIGLKVEWRDAALLILVMTGILTLELTNTVVERMAALLEPRVHPTVGLIKDLMAGAVLITSVGAFLIGVIILWPYFFGLR